MTYTMTSSLLLTWRPCVFSASVAGLECSAGVSENCNVLVHSNCRPSSIESVK